MDIFVKKQTGITQLSLILSTLLMLSGAGLMIAAWIFLRRDPIENPSEDENLSKAKTYASWTCALLIIATTLIIILYISLTLITA